MSEFQEVTISQEPAGFEAPAVPGVERPENVPEQFWDAEKGAVNTEALLAAVAGKTPEAAAEETPEGEAKADETPEGKTEEETKAEELAAEAGVNVAEVEAHFLEKGEIPADTYEKMAKAGISKEMVDEFVQYRVTQGDLVRDEVLRPYGGMEAVGQMVEWAGKNWTEDQANSFNEAVNSGSKAKIDLAVKALKADYDKKNGVRPTLVTPSGGSSANSGAFSSLQDMMAAQRDPRYNSDPAYRDSVMAKLARSKF